MTKDNIIKVGDFGISKMLTTKGQAHTMLGTPYYISPEMVIIFHYVIHSLIFIFGKCLSFSGNYNDIIISLVILLVFFDKKSLSKKKYFSLKVFLLMKNPYLIPEDAYD